MGLDLNLSGNLISASNSSSNRTPCKLAADDKGDIRLDRVVCSSSDKATDCTLSRTERGKVSWLIGKGAEEITSARRTEKMKTFIVGHN